MTTDRLESLKNRVDIMLTKQIVGINTHRDLIALIDAAIAKPPIPEEVQQDISWLRNLQSCWVSMDIHDLYDRCIAAMQAYRQPVGEAQGDYEPLMKFKEW